MSAEKPEVVFVEERVWETPDGPVRNREYHVGRWGFSADFPSSVDDEGDLAYIDEALAAWGAWRDFVAGGHVWEESE